MYEYSGQVLLRISCLSLAASCPSSTVYLVSSNEGNFVSLSLRSLDCYPKSKNETTVRIYKLQPENML